MKLDVVADEPGFLVLQPENLATFDKLVDESGHAVRRAPLRRIPLAARADRPDGAASASSITARARTTGSPHGFTDWKDLAHDRNVVSHEIVHSWNGKYRRPAQLWTPDYRQPMQDNLLWMYEGQTQFWGWVLAARSGLQDKDTVLGAFANSAGATTRTRPAARGARSRTPPTIRSSTHAARAPTPTSTATRTTTAKACLVWLEADQLIRQGTGGARGLDDFAKAFFGVNDGDWGQLTYEFEDIVTALNGDLSLRLGDVPAHAPADAGQPAPLKGIEMGGYKLVWKEEPNPYRKGQMKTRQVPRPAVLARGSTSTARAK